MNNLDAATTTVGCNTRRHTVASFVYARRYFSVNMIMLPYFLVFQTFFQVHISIRKIVNIHNRQNNDWTFARYPVDTFNITVGTIAFFSLSDPRDLLTTQKPFH